MTHHQKRLLLAVIGIVAIVLLTMGCLWYSMSNERNRVPPANLSDSRYFIAHATGSVEGYNYMNCREALQQSLENGYRYIEVDLDYTADSVLVCIHNWEFFNKASILGISWNDSSKYNRIPTYDEFRQRKLYGRFTPLSLDDVIAISQEQPFTIVVDRVGDASALNKYFDKEMRQRVMVEAFSEEEYRSLKANGYVPMLSLQNIQGLTDCLGFVCRQMFRRDVEWIVVEYHSDLRILYLLKRWLGVKIAAYTVNLPSFLYHHLGNEIDMAYTDNWNLKTLMNNYQDQTTLE